MGDGAGLLSRADRRLRPLVRRRAAPPVRFVLLTPGRSGSVLLLTLLASHPNIATDFELLARRTSRPDGVLGRAGARVAATRATTWGFSLHPQHLAVQAVSDPVEWCGRLHDDDWRFVTLVRRNVVHAALSSLLSKSTGRWHEVATARDEPPVAVDPVEALRVVNTLETATVDAERLVGDRSHLALWYEDDLRDEARHQSTVDRVCRFLGVAPAPVQTQLLRRSTPLRDRISNYAELVDVFAATRHGPRLAEAE